MGLKDWWEENVTEHAANVVETVLFDPIESVLNEGEEAIRDEVADARGYANEQSANVGDFLETTTGDRQGLPTQEEAEERNIDNTYSHLMDKAGKADDEGDLAEIQAELDRVGAQRDYEAEVRNAIYNIESLARGHQAIGNNRSMVANRIEQTQNAQTQIANRITIAETRQDILTLEQDSVTSQISETESRHAIEGINREIEMANMEQNVANLVSDIQMNKLSKELTAEQMDLREAEARSRAKVLGEQLLKIESRKRQEYSKIAEKNSQKTQNELRRTALSYERARVDLLREQVRYETQETLRKGAQSQSGSTAKFGAGGVTGKSVSVIEKQIHKAANRQAMFIKSQGEGEADIKDSLINIDEQIINQDDVQIDQQINQLEENVVQLGSDEAITEEQQDMATETANSVAAQAQLHDQMFDEKISNLTGRKLTMDEIISLTEEKESEHLNINRQELSQLNNRHTILGHQSSIIDSEIDNLELDSDNLGLDVSNMELTDRNLSLDQQQLGADAGLQIASISDSSARLEEALIGAEAMESSGDLTMRRQRQQAVYNGIGLGLDVASFALSFVK